MTNDLFMKNLPYVSPYSGLVSKDDSFMDLETGKVGYTGIDNAIQVLFPDDNGKTLQHLVIGMVDELDSFGIKSNQKKARIVALYHAASDYCSDHEEYTLNQLFPAIKRDFDEIGLTSKQCKATYDAFQESKFEGNYVKKDNAEHDWDPTPPPPPFFMGLRWGQRK